jgi:hypothetical protein
MYGKLCLEKTMVIENGEVKQIYAVAWTVLDMNFHAPEKVFKYKEFIEDDKNDVIMAN